MLFKDKIPFHQWINDNNPDSSLSYSKGWWAYIHFIEYLSVKFDADVSVVGTYSLETPPPTENLTLPVIHILTPAFECYVKEYFSYGGFADEWFVSITSVKLPVYNEITNSYLNPLSNHLKKDEMKEEGLTYDDYSIMNLKQFSGTVNDSHDLFALFKHLSIINSLSS